MQPTALIVQASALTVPPAQIQQLAQVAVTEQTPPTVCVGAISMINSLTTLFALTVVILVLTAVRVLQPLCAALVTTMEAITIVHAELNNSM